MDSAKTDAGRRARSGRPRTASWLWYNDTIETHAFALRTLMELQPKDPRRDGLVLWLLLTRS